MRKNILIIIGLTALFSSCSRTHPRPLGFSDHDIRERIMITNDKNIVEHTNLLDSCLSGTPPIFTGAAIHSINSLVKITKIEPHGIKDLFGYETCTHSDILKWSNWYILHRDSIATVPKRW